MSRAGVEVEGLTRLRSFTKYWIVLTEKEGSFSELRKVSYKRLNTDS